MLISVSRHLIHSSESIKPPFKSRLISIGYYPTVSAVLHNILSSSSTTTITSTIVITVTINALPLPNLCVHPTDGLNCFTLYSQELHYHFYYHYHCIATDFSITIHHYWNHYPFTFKSSWTIYPMVSTVLPNILRSSGLGNYPESHEEVKLSQKLICICPIICIGCSFSTNCSGLDCPWHPRHIFLPVGSLHSHSSGGKTRPLLVFETNFWFI